MLEQVILDIIPSCCEVDFLSILACSTEERTLVQEVLPNTNTIIVLAHHVKTALEWAWFPLEAERNQNSCGADLHAKSVLERIGYALKDEGFASCLVAYPGKCGIRMKKLADKTRLGKIGDSYLFLHNEWGPWTHLRLLLTDAIIEGSQGEETDVCIHCGKCLSACPAKAIGPDSFDGIACGRYQESQWNGVKDNYFWKCEECARVCPIGYPPLPLKITSIKT